MTNYPPTIKDRRGKYETNGTYPTRNVGDITAITVHHTASRYKGSHDQILKSLSAGHVKQGWPGLSYHFIIMKNGDIYALNDFRKTTWHDTINHDSIGVCLHGYFHKPHNEYPTTKQLSYLKWLLDWLCTQNPQFPADHDDVVGHRDRFATSCPGDTLYPYITQYKNMSGNVAWGGSQSISIKPASTSDINKNILMKSGWWDLTAQYFGHKESETFSHDDLISKYEDLEKKYESDTEIIHNPKLRKNIDELEIVVQKQERELKELRERMNTSMQVHESYDLELNTLRNEVLKKAQVIDELREQAKDTVRNLPLQEVTIILLHKLFPMLSDVTRKVNNN